VDGRRVPVEVVDLTLPAVRLPGGSGVVELRYQPASLIVGCWVAVLTLLAVGLLGMIDVARRLARGCSRQAVGEGDPGRSLVEALH
jgi:hypothetical protein